MRETRVMLGAPALLLVHPAIIANSLNVPAPFFFVFKFMFKGFFHLQFAWFTFFFAFSFWCWFFIVERGAASVVVKVLRVGGSWFVVEGTPGTRCCWVSDLICMGNFNIQIKLIRINLTNTDQLDSYVEITHTDQVDLYKPYGSS